MWTLENVLFALMVGLGSGTAWYLTHWGINLVALLLSRLVWTVGHRIGGVP